MKNTRYSIGRNLGGFWTETLAENRIDMARKTRDSLNRAREPYNQVAIKEITTIEKMVR